MIPPAKTQAIGILETTGFTPAIVALDVMDKTASIQLIQAELNDYYGVVIKIVGGTAAVRAAIDAGLQVANTMGGKPVSTILNRPDPAAWPALDSKREFNPLIQQYVVIEPDPARSSSKERVMAEQPSFALGFLETQGFTAVFEAIDSACKAANVEVVCKEKLGGGYVTVVIKGDVAAVKAAVESGKTKVEGLGKLIAAHVIARPSGAALSLLPK
ncbi:MAG: BMC domain-containing protein [Planctomycetes bacterium]|nr:BMC domain-containing protein [Planctomycetota bacterium]